MKTWLKMISIPLLAVIAILIIWDTKDRRYVKIVEVIPINLLLRSTREQRNIIYSFVSYLKNSPIRVQFKVLTRRADINLHIPYTTTIFL